MALTCAIALSTTSYAAGQTPPPVVTVLCGNATASALVVTSVQPHYSVVGSTTKGNPIPFGAALPAYGPGAPVTVPALGSASIGPFAITVGNVAAGVVANGGLIQPSQPTDYTMLVGATVTASDGSVNEAAPLGLLVSYTVRPIGASQGGQLIFSAASNSAGWFFFA